MTIKYLTLLAVYTLLAPFTIYETISRRFKLNSISELLRIMTQYFLILALTIYLTTPSENWQPRSSSPDLGQASSEINPVLAEGGFMSRYTGNWTLVIDRGANYWSMVAVLFMAVGGSSMGPTGIRWLAILGLSGALGCTMLAGACQRGWVRMT